MIDPGTHRPAIIVIPAARAARHERPQEGQADDGANSYKEPEEHNRSTVAGVAPRRRLMRLPNDL